MEYVSLNKGTFQFNAGLIGDVGAGHHDGL